MSVATDVALCILVHYENMSVQYEAISKSGRCKNVTFFLIFAQNIDCGYTLNAVLTCIHNLCFRAKIRKVNTPVNPSFTI